MQAQKEFHVTVTGSPQGNGSMAQPWDLQSALSQQPDVINGGDIVWVHEGVYDGRFVSTLKSTVKDKNVTVAPYHDQKVVLNGNVSSDRPSVLEVRGNNVTFKLLEITFVGDFPRHMADANFKKVDGVNHLSGEDCAFIALKIHNNPGSGFGSWKLTGGTLISGCQIFNNGYFSKVRGSGAGMYVQNSSDKVRLIKDNLIFNNYYIGVEVWSATTRATAAYVQNISLKNNVIFNNGLPGGHHKNNLLVATADRNGTNRASNIIVDSNILYHNTDIANNKSSGDAGSLQLGVKGGAPLKNISVINNVIIGGNNALRLNTAEDIAFDNNIVYGGYVHLYKAIIGNMSTWNFTDNCYYSKNIRNFRVIDYKDYTFKEWQQAFNIDGSSQWKNIKAFSLRPVLNIIQSELKPSEFYVSLFDKEGKHVTVDFSDYSIPEHTKYTIQDIASEAILSEGFLLSTGQVIFEMGTENDTYNNFGVYKIVFEK